MAHTSAADVTYAVERTNRRTVGIYLERDGSVLVKAPQAISNERIEKVVQSKRNWVYRAQARWAALNPQPVPKEFVSGETVYFLGQPHRLDFRSDMQRSVERVGDVFALDRAKRGQAEALLKGFYRQEGLKRIPEMVAQHAKSMGVSPNQVRIQELGHRWGSCSEKGTLNFHWKALAVPVEALHYVVVHELAHLVHRDHSSKFWWLVEQELPGWQRHEQWLAEHGAQMTL